MSGYNAKQGQTAHRGAAMAIRETNIKILNIRRNKTVKPKQYILSANPELVFSTMRLYLELVLGTMCLHLELVLSTMCLS